MARSSRANAKPGAKRQDILAKNLDRLRTVVETVVSREFEMEVRWLPDPHPERPYCMVGSGGVGSFVIRLTPGRSMNPWTQSLQSYDELKKSCIVELAALNQNGKLETKEMAHLGGLSYAALSEARRNRHGCNFDPEAIVMAVETLPTR
jgi:hypothetical protein